MQNIKNLNLKHILLAIGLVILNSCSLPQAINYNISNSLGSNAPQKAPSISNVKRKIGNPYSIKNEHGRPIWYSPLSSSEGYKEYGIASWYGKDFHAKKTANGEDYNMYAYTAAHKTLPLPTYVRVTNTQNGKSIVVRVNDRGPFYKKRVIDMSYAGAHALGFDKQGTAPVLVEAISIYGGDVNHSHIRAKKPTPPSQYQKQRYSNTPKAVLAPANSGYQSFTTRMSNRGKNLDTTAQTNQATAPNKTTDLNIVPSSNGYFVQLGSFTDINNARRTYYAAKRDIANVKIVSIPINNRTYYRVVVDNLKNAEQANSTLSNVKALGFNDSIISTPKN
jgi:rare lipoprotein A